MNVQTALQRGCRWIAVRHRAMSTSVYFGPFDTIDEAAEFATAQQLFMEFIPIIDPTEEPSEWWWD